MCKVENCLSPAHAKDYCRKHYVSFLRYGDPLKVKTQRVDGRTKHPLYAAWRDMKARCQREVHKKYHRYGGRGIKVCDEWESDFWQFVSDVGDKPDGMTLDRIDNDGNYEPSNVRWSDALTQSRNRACYKRTPEVIAKVLSFPRRAKNGRGNGMTYQEIADEIGDISAYVVGEIVRDHERLNSLSAGQEVHCC